MREYPEVSGGTASLDELLRATPKAELHVHLEGCLEPDLLMRCAARNKLLDCFADAEDMRARYQFKGLAEFVAGMQRNSSVLRSGEDYYDLALGYLRRAHADRVVHVEMSMSPQGAAARGISQEEMVEGVIAAFDDARSSFGITGGIIVGCLRHVDPSDALAMIGRLKPYRDDVLALGLHGPENGYPPSLFKRHFMAARDHGWGSVAHAGEDGPPEYIWQALDDLNVDRIDHGVNCESDSSLVSRLCEEQLPLTVCPLSNLHLGFVSSLPLHNLGRLISAGLNISIHSDDPAYFGGYINSHYAECLNAGLCDISQLVDSCRNSITAAFMGEREKAAHLATIDDVVSKLAL